MSARKFLLLLLLLAVLVAGGYYGIRAVTAEEPPQQESAQVQSCYDGDTCTLTSGERVRILGIDAPEISTGDCYAPESRDVLRDLVVGQDVLLTSDPEQGDEDRYGRSLRYMEVAQTGDVGAFLVSNGFAVVYTEYPVQRTQEYLDLQRQAQERRQGVWACS